MGAPRSTPLDIARELYRFRQFFFALVNRDVTLRYRSSVLGLLWAVLNPLLQMVTYTLIFSVFMRTGIPSYPAFLLAGFLPWTWFSTSVLMASNSIIYNAGLIKKIYLPTELLPLVSVASNLVNFLVSLPLLVVLLLAFHLPLTPALAALPLLVAIQFVFTSGVALLVATLNTFYRDTEQLLGLGLMIGFYLTPVLYPPSFVPARFVPFLAANPMYHLVVGYRSLFIDGQWPSAGGLAYAAVASGLLYAVASVVFRRKKFVFAEVI